MISIKDCVITWDPSESIQVQTLDFYKKNKRTHQRSWGGCNSEIWNEDDFEKRKLLVFLNAMQIITRDNVDYKKVHNELLQIEEYYYGTSLDNLEKI